MQYGVIFFSGWRQMTPYLMSSVGMNTADTVSLNLVMRSVELTTSVREGQ